MQLSAHSDQLEKVIVTVGFALFRSDLVAALPPRWRLSLPRTGGRQRGSEQHKTIQPRAADRLGQSSFIASRKNREML